MARPDGVRLEYHEQDDHTAGHWQVLSITDQVLGTIVEMELTDTQVGFFGYVHIEALAGSACIGRFWRVDEAMTSIMRVQQALTGMEDDA